MKRIEVCSRAVIEFEVKQLIRDMKDDELLDFEIIPNPIHKGTFDLKIREFKQIKNVNCDNHVKEKKDEK